MTSNSFSTDNRLPNTIAIVVATRIHLDKATVPPANLDAVVLNFARFCANLCRRDSSSIRRSSDDDDDDEIDDNSAVVVTGVLAVDAAPPCIEGYNLVEAAQAACDKATAEIISRNEKHSNAKFPPPPLHVLAVQPWGKFVPALNALVSWAANSSSSSSSSPSTSIREKYILFCSAETTASAAAIQALLSRMNDDTLVCGALLPGHDYLLGGGETITTAKKDGGDDDGVVGVTGELNGRTTPWNTLAMWNLQKLALTGFQSVSEGLHDDCDSSSSISSSSISIAGVEEVVAIALLQKLLGPDNAKAKLVRIADDGGGVTWNTQSFANDPARQQWHEKKMQSKIERAAKQLELTGLQGIVHHC